MFFEPLPALGLIQKKDVGVILLLIPLSGLGEPINQNKQRS